MAKRYPAQIGNWEIVASKDYSVDGLIFCLKDVIGEIVESYSNCGLLLSGGIDSSVIAVLANEIRPIPCFTIGGSSENPDVLAAMRFAHEKDYQLYIYLPSTADITRADKCISTSFRGDQGVFMALEFARKFVTDILAGDGIDEQLGGYWWHVNRNDEFPEQNMAFKHFWELLESDHLTPMFESAKKVGGNLHWPYLSDSVVSYISRIPIQERVRGGITKAFQRDVALRVGIPQWVIDRPKRGFVNALD